MKKGLSLFFFLLSALVSFAQFQDCSSAIIPVSREFFVPRPSAGFGKRLELKQSRKPDLRALQSENNSVWIAFSLNQKASLTFSICPQFSTDDYDFMLFDARSAYVCDSAEYLVNMKPLRSCISRNDSSLKSCTGLADNDSLKFIPIGLGPSFASAALLDSGKYVLVVAADKPPQGGFSFSYSLKTYSLMVPDTLSKHHDSSVSKTLPKTLCLTTKDSATSNFPNTSWSIHRLSVKTDTVVDSLRTLLVEWGENVMVTAMAAGYLPVTRLYSPPSIDASITDTLLLSKLLTDSLMVLSYVFFEGNSDKILPESDPALRDLLRFLASNADVKIQIQGHVNAPGINNGRGLKKLSEARAYAIKRYLLANGIRRNRVKTEGFGNEKMRYPNPQNAEESEFNRRVEIKILSLSETGS